MTPRIGAVKSLKHESISRQLTLTVVFHSCGEVAFGFVVMSGFTLLH